jgi:hypothetical protein
MGDQPEQDIQLGKDILVKGQECQQAESQSEEEEFDAQGLVNGMKFNPQRCQADLPPPI